MRARIVFTVAVACVALAAANAHGQRLTFERTFDSGGITTLDVGTFGGAIEVAAGDPARIDVSGTVTVRVGLMLPADASDVARKVAAAPPIEQHGTTLVLREPSDARERRAVTVAYVVRVPSGVEVRTHSGSGATRISGISGTVVTETGSSSIDVSRLGGSASLSTGSGAVWVDDVAGALSVTTSSSAITATSLGSGVTVRTQSGAVNLGLAGSGTVDVETGSSAVRVRGARGAATVTSRSGRVAVEGSPGGPWTVRTGSGNVDVDVPEGPLSVHLETGSGSVKVVGADVQGTITRRHVTGTTGPDGGTVRVTTRSGTIQLRAGDAAR